MNRKYLILALIVLLSIATSGCSKQSKEPLSLDNFIEVYDNIEGETFEIYLDEYTDKAVNIVAGKKNNITINYYQMASTEDADELFLTISDVLDNSKKLSSSSTSQKGSSLYRLSDDNGGYYLVKDGTNVIYGKCFNDDNNELLYQFHLLGYYEYDSAYGGDREKMAFERFGYSLTSKPNTNESQTSDDGDENLNKDYETIDGNQSHTKEDDIDNTNNIKAIVLNNIEGNWKNTLDDSDYLSYVFTDGYYMIKEEKYRPVHYFTYISFYYDDEENLCFETSETYINEDGGNNEVNMKYILFTDADGNYDIMNQYINSQNSYDLISTLVRNECNTYEELLNGYLFEYVLLDNPYGDKAVNSTLNKKTLVDGYALLNLDGISGDELIIRYSDTSFYFFTIVNNRVKYRGNLETYSSDPASENDGDLYYDEKYSSLCTYYDGGNAGPSFYNNYQLVGNEFIRVEKLGNKLLGKPIEFAEISHDN